MVYRSNQVLCNSADLAEASMHTGPRSHPNLDYKTAIHRAIFCDKDETTSREEAYFLCPQYRWSDAMVWREETNHRLTTIQNDWCHQRSLLEPPKDHRGWVITTCRYALPRSLWEPWVLNPHRRWRDRQEHKMPSHKSDSDESDSDSSDSSMEVEPTQSLSTDAQPSTSSADQQPRAKPRICSRVRASLRVRYENVNFETRSTRLNNRFSQAFTPSIHGLVRDHQHLIGRDHFLNYAHNEADISAGMPHAPPHKICHWRGKLKDLKTKTRPFLILVKALRKPEIALQGSNGIIRGHQIESFQGTINLRDSVTGKWCTIMCMDPISIVEPRPVLSGLEKEPLPPMLLYSTTEVHVSSHIQALIKQACGDPDREEHSFNVWSGRPEG